MSDDSQLLGSQCNFLDSKGTCLYVYTAIYVPGIGVSSVPKAPGMDQKEADLSSEN